MMFGWHLPGEEEEEELSPNECIDVLGKRHSILLHGRRSIKRRMGMSGSPLRDPGKGPRASNQVDCRGEQDPQQVIRTEPDAAGRESVLADQQVEVFHHGVGPDDARTYQDEAFG